MCMKKSFRKDIVASLNFIDSKRMKRERISYDEYRMIVLSNDEVSFTYKDIQYEIVHDKDVLVYENKFEHGQIVQSNCVAEFDSAQMLLDRFLIDGKSIKEIWDEATFDS